MRAPVPVLDNPGRVRPETAADELAVLRLIAANEQAITDNDPDAYAATYAPDATVEWWDATVTGVAGIRAYFVAQQQKEVLRDVALNTVIGFSGDRATAVSSGLVIRARTAPVQILATMTLVTECRRDGDGWRIVRQAKRADPSFDPKIGSVGDVLARLGERVEALEQR